MIVAALICMAVLAGAPGAASGAAHAAPLAARAEALGSGSFYYYADGQRIPLQLSLKWVAVKFAQADRRQQDAALTAAGAPLDASAPRRTFPGVDAELVPVKPGAAPRALLQGLNSMRQAHTRFSYANPVFEASGSELLITDEFIASFPAALSRAEIDAIDARHGVQLVESLLGQPNTFILKLLPGSELDALQMSNLYQEGGVALSAAPNFVHVLPPDPAASSVSNASAGSASALATPDDTWYYDQWFLHNTQQYGTWMSADDDIKAPEAWNLTPGSSSVVIAIIDEGVELTHEDLSGKLVAGYDATGYGSAGGPCTAPCGNEDDGHGTAVAGIAAGATNNSLGVAGTCPGCSIMPVRVARGDGTGYWITSDAILANGITWAYQHGAWVLNNSWMASPSTAVTQAISNAKTYGRNGKGAVVVAAAGNDNSAVNYPATLSSVIAVGALDMCNKRKQPTNDNCNGYEYWWGGNYGSQLDISAPGVYLTTSDRMGAAGYDSGNYVFSFNGTSGATPMVAGVAGLMLSANPSLSAADVQTLLQSNADDIGAAGFDNQTGYGRVNALRAVSAAFDVLPNTNADIHGFPAGTYYIPSGGRVTPQFAAQAGPIRVASTDGGLRLTSERVHNANGFINEAMGVPAGELTTEYWFPWYDNLGMASWILVGNPSTSADAHVTINIAGTDHGPYTVTPGQVQAYTYAVMNGPVHISSDINVFSSERVATGQGFVQETMGYPNNQLAKEYWFPWYDNLGMTSWILVGNPSATDDAHVTITIAGSEVDGSPFTIGPGGRVTPQFGIMNGPVHITSDINVFTSERVHGINGFVQETMGYPATKLTNNYWFTWYDNLGMISWILVGNPSPDTDAHVTITIAGSEVAGSPFTIPHGGRITPQFGVMNGPVHITSDISVFASERVHTGQGFVQETMGFANNRLAQQYWFPWYDGLTTSEWVLIGRP